MTTSQPVASVPRWRVAIIGAVGILAVGIGIALGGFLLSARGAVIGSGASYVPASAPLYFEVRLEPSEAQDAALREFLGRFPEIEGVDLAEPLYGQLTAKLDETLAAEGTGLSWTADVEPWFDGRVGFAVLDVAVLDPTMPEVPSMVVLLSVSDAAAAQSSIDRIIAESGFPVTFGQQEHAGVTIHVDEDSGAAYALTDDQLILAPAADDVVAALDAHASNSTTLSEAGSITSLTDALPDEWLLFGIYDFTDVLASSLEGSAMSGMMADLIANQPMRGAMALTVGGDRVSLPMVSDPPTGSFAVSNVERGLADEVPGDALYYAESGNVGGALSAVIGALKESVAELPGGAEQLEMAEAAVGGDIEALVDWMGDAAVAAGYTGDQPWGGAIIVPTDMEDARRTIDQLSTFAGLATLDPSIGITIEERDVAGVEVTRLRWSDPNAAEPDPAMPMPFTPLEVVAEWAVTDDRVLLGFGDRFVEGVLGQEAAGSLAEAPRYRDAVAALGGSSNAGVTWVDLRGIREAVLAAVSANASPMALMGIEDTIGGVLPWLEPLDRLVAVSRIEGDLLQNESVLLVE